MEERKYAYIGDISQLFRVENYRMEGGRKDGVRATQIMNESGLQFTVIADRCMDIAYVSYKGVNLSYINPNGICAPQYYDNRGTKWLENFTAGFVTTCGLDNIGSPCVDGKELGLHGKISNIPADDYSVRILEKEEGNEVQLTGRMKENFLFGEKLHLRRTITAYQEKNRIVLEDEIINTGFEEQEYMQLYHFNIGYPFLSPSCELFIPTEEVKGANEYSERNLGKWNQIGEPSSTGEMCFLHRLKRQGDTTCVGMFNHKLQMGFTLKFDNQTLDKFLQWRYLNKGEYVLGFEPATNYIGGRTEERKKEKLKTLSPRGKETHKLQIDFYDRLEDVKNNILL